MIVPAQIPNPYVKPQWQAPVGVMESVVAYNCRKYGMPRPVLAMPMWEGAGDRAIDLSGRNRHGAITGAEWVADGLDFNGSSNRVDSDILLTEPFTISSWYKTTTYSDTVSSVADKSVGDQQHRLTFSVDKLAAMTYDGTASSAIDTVNSCDGKWHHGVAVFASASHREIFRDGYSRATNTDTRSVSGVDRATIGVSADSTPYGFFNGLIGLSIFYNIALSVAQIKFLYDNPYFMYRMPEELYGYVAAGGTIRELSTTIPITTLTSTPDINILREIASTSATVTSTNAIDVLMLRELVSTIPITTLTSDISANILREITSTSATSTSASAADLNILRELVATIAVQMGSAGSLKIMRELVTSIDTLTALSQIELLVAGLIEFSATIATTTSTSAAKLNILRELTATIASQTGSSAILDVLREITSTISVTTSTSDIELITMVLRELATTIATTTATSSASFNIVRNLESVVATETSLSDIILIVPQLRELIATIAATTTTSTPNLNVIRPLLSTISTETSTSDVSLAILRALTAQIATGTDVSDAAALVLRELTSTVSTETLTSSINLLVGAVALLVDTEIVSLTPERTVNSITDIRTLSSLTVDRTIESI